MLLPEPKRRCRRDYRQFGDGEYIYLQNKRKNKKGKADWGSVREEILMEIAKRIHTLESFECFGSVCRSWRAAAAEFPQPKTTLERPWLMLPGEAEKEEEDKDCFVISRRVLLGGTITRKIVDLPRGVTKNHHHKQYFISCKDWLLVVSGEDGDDASLVHPLSGVQIPLPSLATLRRRVVDRRQRPDLLRHKIIHKFVLSADPFSTRDNDFFVMVIWGQYYCLGFCKPGDTSWKLSKPLSCGYHDHVFYELMYHRDDKKLYALNQSHRLAVCDIHGSNPTKLNFLHTLTIPRLFRTKRNKRYLLEWKSNTLLVVYHHLELKRNVRGKKDLEYRFETVGFVVAEVDVEDGTCSEVKQLGNRSLFVGGNSSFQVDCSEQVNKDIRPNCIYFAGNNHFLPPTLTEKSLKARGTKEIGIYSLSDRSVQYLLSYDDNKGVIAGRKKRSPPIWFGPSF